jgi:hypothetical protein
MLQSIDQERTSEELTAGVFNVHQLRNGFREKRYRLFDSVHPLAVGFRFGKCLAKKKKNINNNNQNHARILVTNGRKVEQKQVRSC